MGGSSGWWRHHSACTQQRRCHRAASPASAAARRALRSVPMRHNSCRGMRWTPVEVALLLLLCRRRHRSWSRGPTALAMTRRTHTLTRVYAAPKPRRRRRRFTETRCCRIFAWPSLAGRVLLRAFDRRASQWHGRYPSTDAHGRVRVTVAGSAHPAGSSWCHVPQVCVFIHVCHTGCTCCGQRASP